MEPRVAPFNRGLERIPSKRPGVHSPFERVHAVDAEPTELDRERHRAGFSGAVAEKDNLTLSRDRVVAGEHLRGGGHAYVMRDEVRRLDAQNIVDLLLTDLAGFRDVVELKRPDARVLRADPSHGSYFFSSDASRAIGQAHKYMDVWSATNRRLTLPCNAAPSADGASARLGVLGTGRT